MDLGCGNGLLVYILIKEGHKGVGIDVRRRQIWSMYSDDVILEVQFSTNWATDQPGKSFKFLCVCSSYWYLITRSHGSKRHHDFHSTKHCNNLCLLYFLLETIYCNTVSCYNWHFIFQEKTITPSDTHLFPETDWLIGNHSDELTPWIPVIAARSSYKCNFFLLPCCAHNFDGSKYQRQNSTISQYTEYLQYIKQLCEDCGFQTHTDRLKIPSTKRICHIGRGRTYPIDEFDLFCDRIQNLISEGSNSTDVDCERLWIKDFKARETTEKVRNCTQLDKGLVERIVGIISNHLLDSCNSESVWSIGKRVELSEVIKIIPKDDLKALKSECGGLQTLLKNNHHIFKVQSGTVQLRHPKTIEEVYKSQNKIKINTVKVQQKPCWFYNNHPHGCPLTDMQCSFLHIKSQ